MRPLSMTAAAALLLLSGTQVHSADYGRQCFSGAYTSPLLNYSRPQLDEEINRRYEAAVETSLSEAVIYRNTQLWTWANETKVSCGKVLGYLKSDELNGEYISQCDCFYGVMFYLAN